MSRPIQLLIHANAIRHNLKIIRRGLNDTEKSSQQNEKILAVIKADAYGVGVCNILPILQSCAVDALGLIEFEHAAMLRKLGWDKKIVMLEGAFTASDVEQALTQRLDLVIHHAQQVDWLADRSTQSGPTAVTSDAVGLPKQWGIFLKLNSGMNRLGFRPPEYLAMYRRIRQLSVPHLTEIVHTTHFANADILISASHSSSHSSPHSNFHYTAGDSRTPNPDDTSQLASPHSVYPNYQFHIFGDTLAALDDIRDSRSMSPAPQHWQEQLSFSNSSARFNPQLHRLLAESALFKTHFTTQWVRTGVSLHGGSPLPEAASAQSFDLQAAQSLISQIIAVQTLEAGESVGYGSCFTAPKTMRIGVVSCGYADGYPRHAPTGTPVFLPAVQSQTQIVGRVSMDMLTIDLTPFPTITLGDSVELWGENLAIDEVAIHTQTIAHDLMCSVLPRVPRVVIA